MASTNKTTNLTLSQFLGSDKLQRVDYNADMLAIDGAVGALNEGLSGAYNLAGQANGTASQALSDASTAQGLASSALDLAAQANSFAGQAYGGAQQANGRLDYLTLDDVPDGESRKLSDSAPITLLGDWTALDYQLHIKKFGNSCTLVAVLTGGQIAANTDILSVPSGFFPADKPVMAIATSQDANLVLHQEPVILGTDGILCNLLALSGSSMLIINFSYEV